MGNDMVRKKIYSILDKMLERVRINNKERKDDKGLPSGATISQFVHALAGSFSQYNEDLILDVLLSCKKYGTYLDIGANDPSVFNNTERFYRRGWSGVNIEPNLDSYTKLCQYRKRDINLNIGIGPNRGEMTFYQMSADTLSSFDKEAALEGGKIHGATLLSTKQVMVRPLSDIFEEHLKERYVDFMSVDAEGYDLAVLKSNDWTKYRPYLLIVEINRGGKEIVEYLGTCNYMLVYTNGTNGIFMDMNNHGHE
jgi:FkbM family methyltransferase